MDWLVTSTEPVGDVQWNTDQVEDTRSDVR